jgi:hypothetical protein
MSAKSATSAKPMKWGFLTRTSPFDMSARCPQTRPGSGNLRHLGAGSQRARGHQMSAKSADVRRKNGLLEPNADVAGIADMSLQPLSPARTKPKPKPTTPIRAPKAPPREPEAAKELRCRDGDDDKLCHILLYGNRTLCGIRFNSGSGRRVHRDPDLGKRKGQTQCAGCKRPRCPTCQRIYDGGG